MIHSVAKSSVTIVFIASIPAFTFLRIMVRALTWHPLNRLSTSIHTSIRNLIFDSCGVHCTPPIFSFRHRFSAYFIPSIRILSNLSYSWLCSSDKGIVIRSCNKRERVIKCFFAKNCFKHLLYFFTTLGSCSFSRLAFATFTGGGFTPSVDAIVTSINNALWSPTPSPTGKYPAFFTQILPVHKIVSIGVLPR